MAWQPLAVAFWALGLKLAPNSLSRSHKDLTNLTAVVVNVELVFVVEDDVEVTVKDVPPPSSAVDPAFVSPLEMSSSWEEEEEDANSRDACWYEVDAYGSGRRWGVTFKRREACGVNPWEPPARIKRRSVKADTMVGGGRKVLLARSWSKLGQCST